MVRTPTKGIAITLSKDWENVFDLNLPINNIVIVQKHEKYLPCISKSLLISVHRRNIFLQT